jgi:hypothetical protein
LIAFWTASLTQKYTAASTTAEQRPILVDHRTKMGG